MDYSPPGSSVHGASQERYWSGFPFLSLGIFPTQGWNSHLLHWQAGSSPLTEPAGKPKSAIHRLIPIGKGSSRLEVGHTFSVNGKIVNIWNFTSQTVPVSPSCPTLLLYHKSTHGQMSTNNMTVLQNLKQQQMAGWIWALVP